MLDLPEEEAPGTRRSPRSHGPPRRRGHSMTLLAAKPAATAAPMEVFVARAEARACLWREGELKLQEAVDVLQAAAVQTGLVGALGQDAVQAIMAKAFAAVHADADAKADADVDRGGYLDHHEAPERGVVAKSTIDAAEYLVCQGDADRLRRFLAAHSAEQRIGIRKHLEAKQCPRSARTG